MTHNFKPVKIINIYEGQPFSNIAEYCHFLCERYTYYHIMCYNKDEKQNIIGTGC